MNGFISYVILRNKVPEMPKNTEKIMELLEKNPRFEIIERCGTYALGTTREGSVKLRCPFCKSEFTGMESEGCFHYDMEPYDCPVCKFPTVLVLKL